MQDDILFAGTIADNISFFDVEARREDVQTAASMARIQAEILAMPMRFNTAIGDLGSSLSGGQRQRLMLARALYRKPWVLILDEATSHLDVENERAINDVVRGLPMTRIVIAHRPETIASADRSMLLSAGVLKAEAREDRLLHPVD